MELRRYESEDLPQMANLFRETIETVCTADYDEEQRRAWSGRWTNLLQRDQQFQQSFTLLAMERGKLLGFGNVTADGYLDMLYVHKDHQRQGIATAICDRLEQQVKGAVRVDASLTAWPFFEKRGYHLLRENCVNVDGVLMNNVTLCKEERP